MTAPTALKRFPRLNWLATHVRPWRVHRLLGRLHGWRHVSRRWHKIARASMQRPRWGQAGTLFVDAEAAVLAEGLRRCGYCCGFSLPPYLVQSLCRHARTTPCWPAGDSETERFLFEEVRDGKSPAGRPVPVADVPPESCPATPLVAGDAMLVDVVRRHLGYLPTRVDCRLYWSPRAPLGDEERRWNGQTIDWHYDIEPRSSVYLYFYLSDTDRESGAHVVMAGSHGPKPWRLKLASTRQSEAAVLGRYGADHVVVIEGPAGSGFFEDPACYHKVLPPLTADRLMFQLRYS